MFLFKTKYFLLYVIEILKVNKFVIYKSTIKRSIKYLNNNLTHTINNNIIISIYEYYVKIHIINEIEIIIIIVNTISVNSFHFILLNFYMNKN